MVLGPIPKSGKTLETEAKLNWDEQQRRDAKHELENAAERDPETGKRPGVVDRVKDSVEGVVDGIASHLPHAKP
jgi:hypothetical protein